MNIKHTGLLAIAAPLLLAACAPSSPDNLNHLASTESDMVKVLSNRPDMISGGDALIEVLPPAEGNNLRVLVNNQDASMQVQKRSNGRIMGLITDLPEGENLVRVEADGVSSNLTITNHPDYGPIFSAGQHRIDGWDACQRGEVSSQKDCNVEVSYSYLYKSVNPLMTDLVPFDPANGLPGDMATTTTDNGETVPFIVRREDGYQDRDRYTILVLYQPEQDWSAWEPQPQWNRKLLVMHGQGCGMSFNPGGITLGDATSGLVPVITPQHSYITALGKGFAVMSTALNNNGHNCDVVLQAESMMMAKERLIEQYGELRYTIGSGCSGGAIAQQTVANAYPGIYQGLLITCAYPDTMSPAVQAVDYHLMRRYFENPFGWNWDSIWLPHQFGLVEGHLSHLNAIVMDEGLYKAATNAAGGCAGERSYHPTDNPEGIRCGAIEWHKHVVGTQKVTAKTGDREIDVVKSPVGNIGVQYGLNALRNLQITPAQFVDLNVKIGGVDMDMRYQPERNAGDEEAIAAIFRSGAGNVTNNMDTVAIINFVGADPGFAHDSLHAWWTRWRLEREHGHHKNHVMWAGPIPLVGDINFFNKGLEAMDRWLSAVEASSVEEGNLATRILAHKPDDIEDMCSDGFGNKSLLSDLCLQVVEPLFAYGTPRTVAGADRYATNYSCQLKPFSRNDDYGFIPFTEGQWQALEGVFADGVCDYSLPGLGEETKTIPWLSYQDGSGDIVVGGAELPALSYPAGWGSKAFSDMWASKTE